MRVQIGHLRSGHRTRLGTAGVALAASAAMLTGCSGASSGTSSGEPGAVVRDDSPPQSGGVLETAAGEDPVSLDIHKEASYAVHYAVGTVYSRLLAFKTGPDEEYGTDKVEGELATDWSMSKDAKTWTFKLRKGVHFHDKPPVNGRELTSADVLCTMDRITSLPGHQVGLLQPVKDISAPDDYTVVFELASPHAAFDQTMANPFMAIVPCEGTNGGFDLAEEAIGTGPFVLDEWVKDKERTYVKNENYFVKGRPYLDGMHVSAMPDAQAQIAALRSDKLSMINSLNTEKRQVDALVEQVDGLQMLEEMGTNQTRVFMNAAAGPFKDVRVRRAVALAIDKEGMIEAIRAGGQVTGPLSPNMFGALPQEEIDDLVPHDPDRAKQLLADAGYPDGFSTTLVTTTGYGETVVREAQWVQEDLAKIGIESEIEIQDYATYVSSTWPKTDYEIMYGLQTPMLTADEYFTSEYTSTGTRNWSNVKDPKVDKMVAEQRLITDPPAREKKLQEIERYLMENVSTPLPLYVYLGQTLLAPEIRGYYPHPDYSSRELQDVWIKQE